MSIIIDGTEIAECVVQGGIQESTQRVYEANGADGAIKGAHYVYSISAQVRPDVKEALSECMAKTAVECTVGGDQCTAEMTNFTAALVIEYGDLILWDVSFTLTDTELSDESGEQ